MIASEGQAAGHGCQVPVPRCRSQARDQSREAEAKRKGSQVVGGCLAYTVCPLPVYRRFCPFSRAAYGFAPLLVQHRYGMPRGASLRASALRCNGFTPSLHLDLNMDRSGVSLLRSSRSAFPCPAGRASRHQGRSVTESESDALWPRWRRAAYSEWRRCRERWGR